MFCMFKPEIYKVKVQKGTYGRLKKLLLTIIKHQIHIFSYRFQKIANETLSRKNDNKRDRKQLAFFDRK